MTIRELTASRRPRTTRSFRPNAMTGIELLRSSTVNFSTSVQLLNEALARARMREPQEVGTSGAYRSAKQIAMNARRVQTRMLGE
jgi:hypothetical protein